MDSTPSPGRKADYGRPAVSGSDPILGAGFVGCLISVSTSSCNPENSDSGTFWYLLVPWGVRNAGPARRCYVRAAADVDRPWWKMKKWLNSVKFW